MLGLILACPHNPAAFRPAERWPDIHAALVGRTPQPNAFDAETPDVVADHHARVERAFDALRRLAADYAPDAVVVVTDDGGAIFGEVQAPQFTLYTGREIVGSPLYAPIGEDPASEQTALPCDQELAQRLLVELVDRELDMTYSQFQNPQAPDDRIEEGARTVIAPALRVLPPGVPVVPLFVNTRRAPAPSGQRCYHLGRAIAHALAGEPRRVALLAAGGLSGDSFGRRAGHVDVTLDAWCLEQLRRGRGERLASLFDLESDTLTGSTAEYRQWIAAAAAAEASGAKANVIDYVPARHAAAGLGFAAWSA